jgi:hypothetical protein
LATQNGTNKYIYYYEKGILLLGFDSCSGAVCSGVVTETWEVFV